MGKIIGRAWAGDRETAGFLASLAFVCLASVRDVYLAGLFQQSSPLSVALVAFVLCSVVFLPIAVTRSPGSLRLLRDRPRELFLINATSGLAWISFFYALRTIEPLLVQVLFAGVGPLSILCLDRWRPGVTPPARLDRVERCVYVGLFTAVALAAAVIASGRSGLGPQPIATAVLGIMLAGGAGISITISTVACRGLNDEGVDPVALVGVRFLGAIAGALTLAMLTADDLSSLRSVRPAGMVIAAAALLVVFPIYVNQVGVALASPLTVRVALAVGPVLIFARFSSWKVGCRRPRTRWSPRCCTGSSPSPPRSPGVEPSARRAAEDWSADASQSCAGPPRAPQGWLAAPSTRELSPPSRRRRPRRMAALRGPLQKAAIPRLGSGTPIAPWNRHDVCLHAPLPGPGSREGEVCAAWETAVTVVIGIDVGATTIAGGLVTHAGDTLATIQAPTHRDGRGMAVQTLFEVLDELVQRARDQALVIDGVGLGLPGLVDTERGAMFGDMSLVPEFFGLPLADNVTSRTGLPAFVDNDVNALALGEWFFGLGRGATSLVVLAIGTGVGGGVILGDTLMRGHRGYGGEFGHVTVDLHGRLCVCGSRGCLSTYVGGHFIALEARNVATFEQHSKLLALAGGDPNAITAELVFQAAADGDRFARSMVDDACDALAAGIGTIVNGLNPEVIVITGGVATSLVPLEREILRRASRYAFAPALAATRVHVIAGGKDETVRGGAALVLYELRRRQARVTG